MHEYLAVLKLLDFFLVDTKITKPIIYFLLCKRWQRRKRSNVLKQMKLIPLSLMRYIVPEPIAINGLFSILNQSFEETLDSVGWLPADEGLIEKLKRIL